MTSFFKIVLDYLEEIRESDRVLDMGTGSGINAILAASKSGGGSLPWG